jgi:hypothetical protein
VDGYSAYSFVHGSGNAFIVWGGPLTLDALTTSPNTAALVDAPPSDLIWLTADCERTVHLAPNSPCITTAVLRLSKGISIGRLGWWHPGQRYQRTREHLHSQSGCLDDPGFCRLANPHVHRANPDQHKFCPGCVHVLTAAHIQPVTAACSRTHLGGHFRGVSPREPAALLRRHPDAVDPTSGPNRVADSAAKPNPSGAEPWRRQPPSHP